MTLRMRRILFYGLAALFVTVAPLLFAYSLGYRFDFTARAVEKTGGIFVKSKLTRLSVFVNGSFARETSLISRGALITNVAPGNYLIRIEKEGYQPWAKAVVVEPEVVTELRRIMLIPREVESATATPVELSILAAPPAATGTIAIDARGNLVERKSGRREVIRPHVHSFGSIGASILFVDKNGFLARVNPASREIATLGSPGFYLSEEPVRFRRSPTGDVAIIDSSGGVFILDTSDVLKPVSGGVREVYFDRRGEKMLLVKERAIEVLWLGTNPYQPFEKRGALETVLALNSPIREARWYFGDDAHVVIQTEEGIFFTELDGRGGRNTYELIPGRSEKLATTPELPNAIFFRQRKAMHKIEL